MKLIDADKLEKRLIELMDNTPGDTQYKEGKRDGWNKVYADLLSGAFDPTPPVQPDIKPGDKVRHVDFSDEKRGPGKVLKISQSGKRAEVLFERTEVGYPVRAYYRLDKLEVIQPDTGEVITDEQR